MNEVTKNKNLPAGVVIVSVMYFLLALGGMIPIGVILLIGSLKSYTITLPFVIAGVIFLGIFVLDISVGVGLLRRKSWARTVGIIFSFLAFIGIITGIVQMIQGNNTFALLPNNITILIPYILIVISGIYLLLNKRVKSIFT